MQEELIESVLTSLAFSGGFCSFSFFFAFFVLCSLWCRTRSTLGIQSETWLAHKKYTTTFRHKVTQLYCVVHPAKSCRDRVEALVNDVLSAVLNNSQFYDNGRRGSWEASGAAAQRSAHGSRHPHRDSYSRDGVESTRQGAAGGSGAALGGASYNKESALAPPQSHRWAADHRNNWRNDSGGAPEGREGPEERPRSREQRGSGTGEGRERFARPRDREGAANGGPVTSRSRSSGENRGGGGGGGSDSGRGRPTTWGGGDASRSGSSRPASGGGDGGGFAGRGGGGDGSHMAGGHPHYSNGRVGNSGDGRGGSSYNGGGWSDRKRSLESFDGQDESRSSPKKVMLR